MDAIKTERLTKFYGRTRGIEELDLRVAEGEFFGFIGPNGAGKSTTIRTLLGLISPTGGSAQLLGLDIKKDNQTILARVGYLPSEAIFYPGMKVRELLRLSADLRKKDCAAEAKRLCERFQLDLNKKVEELSFGNRKKLGVVCALQHRPELLILDEPTGGLDPLMQKEFFDLLRERNREGATVFLSSHILSEVQRNCGRAALIRAGRVVACDSVEALGRTGAKRVTLRGTADLAALGKLRDLQTREDGVSFLYSGGMDRLLAVLAAGRVTDLSVAEPDLEEIFLHYYEKDGEDA